MSATRSAVALAAGACIASAATGASAALTSMPSWAIFFTGLTLAYCSIGGARKEADRKPFFSASACGVFIALALPASAPPAPGAVSTRAAAGAMRGDLFEALDRLDASPDSMLGSAIAVTGTWTPASEGDLATVSRRVVSCCAADAIDVGFDVRLARDVRIDAGRWVRVEGTIGERIVDGDVRYVLEQSRIRGLEDDAANAR